VGYPLGGDSLSITKGIVSRITMTRYVVTSNKLLGIQIDAAINPGNSGGPAFSDLEAGSVAGRFCFCLGMVGLEGFADRRCLLEDLSS